MLWDSRAVPLTSGNPFTDPFQFPSCEQEADGRTSGLGLRPQFLGLRVQGLGYEQPGRLRRGAELAEYQDPCLYGLGLRDFGVWGLLILGFGVLACLCLSLPTTSQLGRD